ncbi:MAG: hypothetical protein ABSG01_09090 [Anaerolineales bacterium]
MPVVTGKGVAPAVDLGDAGRPDRRKPERPDENPAQASNAA